MPPVTLEDLPGLDCGLCGYRTCELLARKLPQEPQLVQRCIHLSQNTLKAERATSLNTQAGKPVPPGFSEASCGTAPACGTCAGSRSAVAKGQTVPYLDSLGREFDFYLEHFPEDPGPREIIIPHNPMITREMEVNVGDILIGRPLGMSCGCPITHCGVAVEVDRRTGVIVWCVTGPLGPRRHGFKDLGYYIAEGYEGIIQETRSELKIGLRYFFQPKMCMLQWRHSGLINYLNRTKDGWQVRLEGLWIG